ncbi:hypothetical protein NPX90_28455, partial [Bacillus paranthracis]|uniref:hypothetical protein n=1 Tax=Bacillus paranthracis TaxID=2026186 RepID=UPI003F68BA22|nr:hypothetical protein [Bacillus paranthracis]
PPRTLNPLRLRLVGEDRGLRERVIVEKIDAVKHEIQHTKDIKVIDALALNLLPVLIDEHKHIVIYD